MRRHDRKMCYFSGLVEDRTPKAFGLSKNRRFDVSNTEKGGGKKSFPFFAKKKKPRISAANSSRDVRANHWKHTAGVGRTL